MKPPSERSIVNAVRKYLEGRGDCWVMKVHGSPMQVAGVPDLIGVLRPGRAFAFEVKRPGEVPTKLQERTLARLRETGALVAVVTSVDEVREAIAKAFPCGRCEGTGMVDHGGVYPWGAPIDMPCPDCEGEGWDTDAHCWRCDGTGKRHNQ